MATNAQVIDAFTQGFQAEAGHLRSTGKALYSYGYRLAWRSSIGGFVWINYQNTGTTLENIAGSRTYDAAFSPTTTRHRSMLVNALNRRKIEHWQHTEGM